MQVYSCHDCLLMSVSGKMTLKDKLTLLSDLAFPRIKTVFHSSKRGTLSQSTCPVTECS